MRIGIPEGLLYYRYEHFIRTFFDGLGVDVVYSGPSNRETLERGIKCCVDEACLPIKIFHGHVSKLREQCDKVVVPRLMKCEFGESICPKFGGLPELVKSGSGKDDLVFTSPLYLNDRGRLQRSLVRDGRSIGLPLNVVLKAFNHAHNESRHLHAEQGLQMLSDLNVALLGHPYNTDDSFVNMNLVDKLNKLGVNVVMGDGISQDKKIKQLDGLIKKPYWLFFRENYGAAGQLAKESKVDGIIYVSSFCCGTDSITIEMVRDKIKDLPMLVLKLDEHTGEAGFNTRIEAFVELLERRKWHANNLSQIRGQSYIRPVAISRDRDGIDNPGSQYSERS